MFTPVEGKTVVVTGASKGIGKGIARVFASKGANVLVVARNEAPARQTADEIKGAGGEASMFAGDVSSWDDMQKMAEAATLRYGGIDILCSNAGIFPSTKLADMSPDDWDHVLGINVKGSFLAVKACVPEMSKSEYGRIILISSITGPITGYAGWAHYGASKAAQLGFMRTAAIELAKNNITVNAVLPGNIITEGLQDMGEEYLRTMASAIPLKTLGTVEDIAYTALFLATKEAGYITGQTIVVDGGQTLPESLEAMEEA